MIQNERQKVNYISSDEIINRPDKNNRFAALHDEMDDCYYTEKEEPEEKEHLYTVQFRNLKQKYDLEDKYVNFINGHGKKPRKVLETFQDFRKKRTFNKPLIQCRLGGKNVRTLLDTGATCNILSENQFKEIQRLDTSIKSRKSNVIINCANSSEARCVGETDINVDLAGSNVRFKFYILRNMSKETGAILGVRAMKYLNLSFCWRRNCAMVNDIELPFLSCIKPGTVFTGNV